MEGEGPGQSLEPLKHLKMGENESDNECQIRSGLIQKKGPRDKVPQAKGRPCLFISGKAEHPKIPGGCRRMWHQQDAYMFCLVLLREEWI